MMLRGASRDVLTGGRRCFGLATLAFCVLAWVNPYGRRLYRGSERGRTPLCGDEIASKYGFCPILLRSVITAVLLSRLAQIGASDPTKRLMTGGVYRSHVMIGMHRNGTYSFNRNWGKDRPIGQRVCGF